MWDREKERELSVWQDRAEPLQASDTHTPFMTSHSQLHHMSIRFFYNSKAFLNNLNYKSSKSRHFVSGLRVDVYSQRL